MQSDAVLIAFMVCSTIIQVATIVVGALVTWQKASSTEHKVDDVHAAVNGSLLNATTALADANTHIAALSLQLPTVTPPATVTPTGAPAWPNSR